ncbi:uncharacterized protein LOC118411282 [Branchiostoma floridae]|uniref:Uncharacterized protein LOC118411282 n=1 Tax=Branchiostoma floridae TaxID=7739 RepID=A0A9J7KT69_BRAFL|nr:uncharacterized protein LOC118411282 [Branchiostoma floridae]
MATGLLTTGTVVFVVGWTVWSVSGLKELPTWPNVPVRIPHLAAKLQCLDHAINQLGTCRPFPGMSIALVKDGVTVLARGYGYADVKKRWMATDRTMFGIGSVSKSFTTALFAALFAKDSRFDFGSKIKDILGPDFRFRDRFRTEEMTLADLLAMRTGLRTYMEMFPVGLNMTREQLARHVRYFEETYPGSFRSTFTYNNMMYVLAGLIAEKIGGESFEKLLRDHIIEPLGMDRTAYWSEVLRGDVRLERVAVSYRTYKGPSWAVPRRPRVPPFMRTSSPLRSWSGHPLPLRNVPHTRSLEHNLTEFGPLDLDLPAVGILSNAVDMAKYMNFQLTLGKLLNGTELVPGKLMHLTHKPLTTIGERGANNKGKPKWPTSSTTTAYGMGWRVGNYNGYKRLDHKGLAKGFFSQVTLFPDAQVGIFTSINGPSAGRDTSGLINEIIHYLAADTLLGERHWLEMNNVCTYPAPWVLPGDRRRNDTADKHNHDDKNLDIADASMGAPLSDTFIRDKKEFVGNYFSRAVGNFTITFSQSEDKLLVRYGLIGRGVIVPTIKSHIVYLRHTDPVEGLGEMPLAIDNATGPVRYVAFPPSSKSNPLVFFRNVDDYDPPAPESLWDCPSE